MPDSTFDDLFREAMNNSVQMGQPRLDPDPQDESARVAEPDRFVVGLSTPYSALARELAAGRSREGPFVLLTGARGSGKSLLLRLVHRAARQTGAVSGHLLDAEELLRSEPSDEDGPGGQRIEELFPVWRREREAGHLAYILVDNASWGSLLSGRLRQVRAFFPTGAPTTVFGVDFFEARDLRQRRSDVFNRVRTVTIHPYSKRELVKLWDAYFASLPIERDLVDGAVERAIGNPQLLLRQGDDLWREWQARGSERLMERAVRAYWANEGYEKALELREHGARESTREEVLIRVAQADGISATLLAREFGLDRALCSYHLGKLEEDGLVFHDRSGASVLYRTLEPIRVAVETHLVMGYDV